MAINKLLFLWFYLSAHLIFAQEGRYALFLSDKAGTPYSVDNPSQFLSEKSINRRVNQSIPIVEEDLPVNSAYVTQVKDLGADVLFTSKWFNAIIVQLDNGELTSILSLPFITGYEYLAPVQTSSGGRIKRIRSKKDSNLGIINQVQTTMLGLDDMHTDGYKGAGITIGVFDSGFSGVDVGSPFQPLIAEGRLQLTVDLVGKTTNVFQYDDHGTEVLSIMAADEPGVYRGGAPEATYQLFVTEDVKSEFRIEEYNWLIAAEKADSAGVDIINSSLGYNLFDDPSMDYTIAQLDGETAVISRAATRAFAKGILVVSSAGNDGNTSWQFINPPADAASVMAVGSITSTGSLSSFSSTGPTSDGRIKPDVVALGSSVSVVKANGTTGFTSGTSASAPLVAGLAAGLRQAFPDLSVTELFDLIILSGNLSQSPNNQLGYGVPNYAVASEILNPTEPEQPTALVSFYPNPVIDSLMISFEIPAGQRAQISIFNLQGQQIMESEGGVTYANNPVVLDLSILSAGMYILKVETQSILSTFRLVKL